MINETVVRLSNKRFAAQDALALPNSLQSTAYTPYQNSFDIHLGELLSTLQRPFWRFKRALDVPVALAMLVILLPILLVVAMFVAASLGFPIMFWQRRPGLHGKPFHLYKFRTMKQSYTPDGRGLTDEECLSWASRFLRQTRLDELPQLFNILRGEMSFVGPRP